MTPHDQQMAPELAPQLAQGGERNGSFTAAKRRQFWRLLWPEYRPLCIFSVTIKKGPEGQFVVIRSHRTRVSNHFTHGSIQIKSDSSKEEHRLYYSRLNDRKSKRLRLLHLPLRLLNSFIKGTIWSSWDITTFYQEADYLHAHQVRGGK